MFVRRTWISPSHRRVIISRVGWNELSLHCALERVRNSRTTLRSRRDAVRIAPQKHQLRSRMYGKTDWSLVRDWLSSRSTRLGPIEGEEIGYNGAERTSATKRNFSTIFGSLNLH